MPVNNTRLGFANGYDNVVRNLTARQSKLASLQENLTSGKRVLRASDDPTAAGQAERSLMRMARIAADQRALEVQKNTIAIAESTLGDITETMQRFRELTVNAGSGSLTAAERKTIAQELTGLREQILSYANRSDNNGVPLFGGLGSAANPFAGPTGSMPDYTYQGLPGQTAPSDVGIATSLDGDSTFMLQSRRDGAYQTGFAIDSTIVPVPIPTPRDPAGRLQTTPMEVTDNNLLTASSYTLKIDSVTAGATPGTTSVTYSIVETPASGATPDPSFPKGPVTLPDYPSNQPLKLVLDDRIDPNTALPLGRPGLPGLRFTLSGTPAAGDTINITPSPSIFSVMDETIRSLNTAVNDNAAAQVVAHALKNLDIGMARIAAARGVAGEMLNRADRINGNQELRSVQLEADRSRAEDLDMIKGVSEFQNQQVGYQAALQSYAQVQKLSLFNFIN